MLRDKISENWQWACLVIVLFITAIYSRPLIPIDETRYLSVAWEMWQNGDFLVPHINGLPYSQKPPLLFWCIHLVWLFFGVGEWSARLVGPFFGFCSIAMTVRLAKLLWPDNKDIHLATPFILIGTLIWSLYSSLTMFDTLLTFLSLLGLNCLLLAADRKSVLPWLGFSVVTGFGILAKGPVILLYVLPVSFLAPFWHKGEKSFWVKWYGCIFLSFMVGTGIALCWAIPAAKAGGEEYRQAILFSQTAGRIVKSFAHARPFYWYILLLPLLLFPWFLWLPAWKGWKNISIDGSTRFCLCVILPSFFLLSSVSGKQLHYILPILPLVALLLSRLAVTVNRQYSPWNRMPIIVLFLLLALVLFIVPRLSLHGGDRDMMKYIPQWIAIIPVLCGFFLLFFRSESVVINIKIISSTIVMFFLFLHLALFKPLHTIYDQTAVGNTIRAAQEHGTQVAIFPACLADQFQFSGRLQTPLIPLKSPGDVERWSIAHPHQFRVIFTKKTPDSVSKKGTAVQRYSNGWLFLGSAVN